MIYLMSALLCVAQVASSNTMTASWYNQGRITASGERFNPKHFTAAHKSLPFGTKIKLQYKDRQVEVRVTDRGPFVKGRHIDISQGAAQALKFTGVGKVEVLAITKP